MGKLLKSLLKGLLYIISFPFIITGIVIAAVIALFIFIFQFFKLIYLFFTGRTLFSDLEEDIKAKQLLGELPKDTPEIKKEDNPYSIYPTEDTLFNGEYPLPSESIQNQTENTDVESIEDLLEGGKNDE